MSFRKDDILEHRGVERTVLEWAIHLNMRLDTLVHRLRKWPVEKALTQPLNCPAAHRVKSRKGGRNSPWRDPYDPEKAAAAKAKHIAAMRSADAD